MQTIKRESIKWGLRKMRDRKGVRQADFAKVVGVAPSTASAWENQGSISFEDAWKAADYYGCSLDELAGRHWPPSRGNAREETDAG